MPLNGGLNYCYWTDECWNELNWQLDLLSITELNGILMDEIIQTYVGLD